MFTRNRLTQPFSGCELVSNVASEDKSWPNKSFSLLVQGFDAAFQPFCALTTSSLVIDLRTCALGFLETFCLGFTGIYFAFRSHICDFIISMSCHQIQRRFCLASLHARGGFPRGCFLFSNMKMCEA